MAWGKVDDGLHKSVKWRKASKPARALWVTALSWSMDELTDGFVPTHILGMLDGTKREAQSLVDAGLWDTRKHGWVFHDWSDYQPDSASIKAKKAKESEGAALGNHRRWHEGKGVRVESCEYCQGMPPELDVEPPTPEYDVPRVPDQVPDGPPDTAPESGAISGSHRPVPEPVPLSSGSESRGGYVSSDNPEQTPQPCGRIHDPEKPCRRCGDVRRAQEAEDAERQRLAIKAKADADRQAQAAERAQRQAEAEAARAEADANPERTKQARDSAMSAARRQG